MNKYPLWKYLLILFVLTIGFFYAAPNLFNPDPAVQISGESSANLVEPATLALATAALKQADIPYFGDEVTEQGKNGLIRLRDREQQLRAQAVVQRAVGDGFVVALNLAPTTPHWMTALAAHPMKLGLDLSGGVHFLLQVDTPAAVKKHLEIAVTGIKRKLREAHVRGFVEQQDNAIVGRFKDKALADQAIEAARAEYPELQQVSTETAEGVQVTWSMTPAKIKEIEDYAVGQNLNTLRNRVNELGVAEPLVQRQGRTRIVVELPGIQDTAEAKRILGKTASLEFRLEARGDADPSTREQFEFRDPQRTGRAAAWLEREVVITGERVTNAKSSNDQQTGQPQVDIVLDSEGGTLMSQATRHNIQRQLGVLFIERKLRTHYEKDAAGKEIPVHVPYDEKKIISLATIQDVLGTRFRITGLNRPGEAAELALLLRSGALAAPMDFVEERTVGPSLGAANIAKGIVAVWVGFLLVMLFMSYYYRAFGMAAIVALAINIVLLIACMSVLSATLTMPGIAGIALTVGMSVDANVLVFARIREELKNGMSPQAAISAGFDRAFITITDSNITALLVAAILYGVGTGPVRGFAVTLALGIVTSMFTALTVTRAIINLSVGGRRVTKLWI